MLILHERVFINETVLEVELHDDFRYRLRYGELVEYTDHRRKLRGRAAPYEFRSVEQLRYDFERDVQAAGGQLGESA